MTTSRRTKLSVLLKQKFGSPRALLRHLGLDDDLLAPASGGGGGGDDRLQKMRTDIEMLLGKLGLSEGPIKAVLEVLDQHAPTDRLPDDDKYAKAAGAIAGNDDDATAIEKFRDFLAGLGMSAADIEKAIALGRGDTASDVLPLSGLRGGNGGAVRGETRSPGERFVAGDERRAADYFRRWPDAAHITVGLDHSQGRPRSRPTSSPSQKRLREYHEMFGGEHIITMG